jgi:hypothetical protein
MLHWKELGSSGNVVRKRNLCGVAADAEGSAATSVPEIDGNSCDLSSARPNWPLFGRDARQLDPFVGHVK